MPSRCTSSRCSSSRPSSPRARQMIDMNRRDASISTLETDVGQLKADLEENQNARRVLEQTVADRLPRVEARLNEAKRLLFNRDREIAELTAGAKRQQAVRSRRQARSTPRQNAQIEQLSRALTTRGGRGRQAAADGGRKARWLYARRSNRSGQGARAGHPDRSAAAPARAQLCAGGADRRGCIRGRDYARSARHLRGRGGRARGARLGTATPTQPMPPTSARSGRSRLARRTRRGRSPGSRRRWSHSSSRIAPAD